MNHEDITMRSQKIIERLQQSDWIIKCETEHELALVLNACLDADISWSPHEQAPFISDQIQQELPVVIGFYYLFNTHHLYWEVKEDYDAGSSDLEDITDWFFQQING